jgi:multiple sugar transport system permease protein
MTPTMTTSRPRQRARGSGSADGGGRGSAGRRRGRMVSWYVIAIILALAFLLPFALLLVTVLKSPGQAAASPPSYLPHPVSGGNFGQLFGSGVNLTRYIGNSLVVSVGTVAGTLILCILGGYGFAMYRFPGRGIWFTCLLIIFMVPFQSVLTPLYVVLRNIHLQNSLLGLVLVYITYQIPFGLFVMRNSFAAIPRGISEAAEIDGAGTLSRLWHIHLRLVLPGVITVAIFAFIAAWNDFIGALILLSDQSKFTLPVELLTLVTGRFGVINWGVLEAGVLISMVPCVAIFLLLQRYYLGGILSGAVK